MNTSEDRIALELLATRIERLEQLAAANDAMAPALRALLALDVPAVQAETERRVMAACVEHDPSAHVVIDDVFPRAFYDLLIQTIPPIANFERLDSPEMVSRRTDPVKADFRAAEGPIAPLASRLCWQILEDDIVDGVVRPALLRLFADALSRHYARTFGADLASAGVKMATRSRGRLLRRVGGYNLKPHLDPKRSIVTGILYCARPGDSEAHGTQLYRVDRPFEAPSLKTFYPEEHGLRCELAKTVAFRANRLFAFINADAAHGAEMPQGAPQKDRYIYQFYVKPSGRDLAALVKRLPVERQASWADLL